MSIRDRIYDDQYEFELYDFDSNGNHIKMKYCGCWLLVDNGYLNWSVTVPPMKSSLLRREIRFSEWLESMRKDVECAFGILKGRWKCLKYGIRLQGHKTADQLWLTCCALHNMLLKVDGLSKKWDKGVPSDWEIEDDNFDSLPFALKRLTKPAKIRTYDLSGMGYGNDTQKTPIISEIELPLVKELIDRQLRYPNEVTCVRDLPLSVFRQKLVRHFNIAFQRNELQWPQRMRDKVVHDIMTKTKEFR